MSESLNLERNDLHEESFGFAGLFDFVELQEDHVGNTIFKIPSVESIKDWRKRRDSVYVSLARGEDTGRTNRDATIDNMIWWIERGKSHLQEGRDFFSKDNAPAVRESLDNARSAFTNAQAIAQVIDQRYRVLGTQTNVDFGERY